MTIHDIPDEQLRRGDIACTILCQMDFRMPEPDQGTPFDFVSVFEAAAQ